MSARAFVLGCALAALSACGPRSATHEEDARAKPLYVAKHWGGILLEFGMPEALPLLGNGWSYGEEATDGNTFRWAVAEEASFSFESDRDGEHLGFIEAEPFRFEGAPAQFLGLTVNGHELPPVELREGRARYPVDLPLVRGRNEVLARFRYAGDPARTRPDRRELAAAFYRFDVPPDDEPPVAGRPGPFAWVEGGIYLPPRAGVTLFPSTGASPALELVIGAESEAAPQLRAARGAALHVTARTRKETWEDTMVAGAAVEHAAVELPFDGTTPVEVRLETKEHGLLVRPVVAETSPKSGGPPASVDTDRNVLVVVLDGANALRMGLYGYERDTTPVLDRLGRESVVFDVAVSQAVYTIASIGSLLTGQYPERHQTVTFADRLREDVPTVAGMLTEAGFRTGAFAGNAVVSDAFGLDRGYETFVSVPRLEGYTGHGDSVVEAFREWLAAIGEDERFFAYVHFREPHFPYNPPPPFDTRFGAVPSFPDGLADATRLDALNRNVPAPDVRAEIEHLYEGNLAYVDSLLEAVLACVNEDTIVIVTADHGEAIFEHAFLGHNTQLYEESIRVPLVVKVPGLEPRRVPDVVELLDLTPTLLELTGLADQPEAAGLQGESLLALMQGIEGSWREAAFTRTVWDKPRYSVRTASHKLIWDSRTGVAELYDLGDDPEETENLAGRDAQAHEEAYLRHLLFTWYREQEKLRAGEPPPPRSTMSSEDERVFDSLGYANQRQRQP